MRGTGQSLRIFERCVFMLLVSTALQGCVTLNETKESVESIEIKVDADQAKVDLKQWLLRGRVCLEKDLSHLSASQLEQCPKINSAVVTSSGFVLNGGQQHFFSKVKPHIYSKTDFFIDIIVTIPLVCLDDGACIEMQDIAVYGVGNDKNVRTTAQLILILKRDQAASELEFKKAADLYQGSATKPTLPEECRRYRVQAESAIAEKNFSDAAEIYSKALKVAPWWPGGHFNRAIVLAEIGDFDQAIVEMNRYLMLEPNAPDARAARDRTYEWERKVGK